MSSASLIAETCFPTCRNKRTSSPSDSDSATQHDVGVPTKCPPASHGRSTISFDMRSRKPLSVSSTFDRRRPLRGDRGWQRTKVAHRPSSRPTACSTAGRFQWSTRRNRLVPKTAGQGTEKKKTIAVSPKKQMPHELKIPGSVLMRLSSTSSTVQTTLCVTLQSTVYSWLDRMVLLLLVLVLVVLVVLMIKTQGSLSCQAPEMHLIRVAEHLGASSRRPRHPFPALTAGEAPGRVPVYTAQKSLPVTHESSCGDLRSFLHVWTP